MPDVTLKINADHEGWSLGRNRWYNCREVSIYNPGSETGLMDVTMRGAMGAMNARLCVSPDEAVRLAFALLEAAGHALPFDDIAACIQYAEEDTDEWERGSCIDDEVEIIENRKAQIRDAQAWLTAVMPVYEDEVPAPDVPYWQIERPLPKVTDSRTLAEKIADGDATPQE